MLVLMLISAGLLQAAVAQIGDYDWDDVTALDDYVHLDDGYFSYELMEIIRYDNFSATVYVFNMTSQKWTDEAFVDRPYWYHDVGFAVPDTLIHPHSMFMLIDGGSNDPDSYPGEDHLANYGSAAVSNLTGTFVGYVRQNPNQPLYFQNDPEYRRRTEDDIIAWSWRTFYDLLQLEGTRRPEIPLRAPMTKGVKRSLDLMQEYAANELGYDITDFYITGASKRGWTTWSIAAVDQRVKGIAPMVMSLLNFDATLMNHFRAMDGGWSFALKPYYEVNLTMLLTDEDRYALYEIEDMFWYRNRLTIPKLLVAATGDEFFLCQDSHHWFDEMPEPMLLLMCPNAEHSLFPCWIRLADTLMSFFMSIIEGGGMPHPQWTWSENATHGEIEMNTDWEPVMTGPLNQTRGVTGFRAVTLSNHTRKDYRLVAGYPEPEPQPVFWHEEEVEEVSYNQYRFTTDKEEPEWVGYFIDVEYESPSTLRRLFLTSEVHIIPETFPRGPCQGDECYGYLV